MNGHERQRRLNELAVEAEEARRRVAANEARRRRFEGYERAMARPRNETEADREAQEDALLEARQREREEDTGHETFFNSGEEHTADAITPPGRRRAALPRDELRTPRRIEPTPVPEEILAAARRAAAERVAEQEARERFVERLFDWEAARRRTQRGWLRRRLNETDEERWRREEVSEDYEEVQQVLADVRDSMDLSYEGQIALIDAMAYAEEMQS